MERRQRRLDADLSEALPDDPQQPGVIFPSERTAERARVVLTKLEPYRTNVPEVRDIFDRHSAA